MNSLHITGTRDAREVARRNIACAPGAIAVQYSNPCAAARYGVPPAARPGPRSASGVAAPNNTTWDPVSRTARRTRSAVSGSGHRNRSLWRRIG
jgi:hypothetical protein